MKRKNLLGIVLLTGSLSFAVSYSPNLTHNINAQNQILLSKPAEAQNQTTNVQSNATDTQSQTANSQNKATETQSHTANVQNKTTSTQDKTTSAQNLNAQNKATNTKSSNVQSKATDTQNKTVDHQNINSKSNENSTSASQNLTSSEVNNLKGKTIQKNGMVFSGLKAMKIAPNMSNNFAVTPGFDSDGFASSVNENLYNYELNLKNDQNSMAEAINLNGGDPINTCVYFQSSSLRGIGQNVPQSIGYTTHLENWLANNGWTKHTNFSYIQKGDICFASYYHTFLFMGWKDKAKGIAWVMGNESFVQPYYRKRNLNGQSPQIYGEDSYTGATVYWTYGPGYQGPQSNPNPIHQSVYNAFGSTNTTTQTPLYQNQGSGAVYATIPSGTNLPVIESSNGWYKVYFDGKFGWISASNATQIAESLGGSGSIGAANTLTGSNIGGPYKNIQSTKYPSIGTGVVTATGGLWLNGNPNLNNPDNIEILPQGANVSIIAQSGIWYKVQYYGQIGWVYGDPNYIQTLMSPSTPSPAADAPVYNPSQNVTTTPADGTTTVNVDLLLNNEPKATFDGATSIATIPAQTIVRVIGKTSNGWYKVKYKNLVGYISGSYTNGFVPMTNPTPQAAPVWKTIDGKVYAFNPNGTKHTGWLKEWGVNYYFNPDGSMAKGWQTINGHVYKFNNEGIMQTGWVNEWGVNYYFNPDGTMAKGWQTIDGYVYKFNNEGIMQTGWVNEWGVNYYFNPNGTMAKGWQTIGNYVYKFDNQGIMQIGWVNEWGANYYFNSNGTMAKGSETINGTVCYFNNQGILQN